MILTVEQQVALAVGFADAAGNRAAVDGAPVWEVSDASVIELVAGADAFQVVARATGKTGLAQVIARADADRSDGIREIFATLDLEVVAGEAVVATITAGAPEAKPAPVVEPTPVEPTPEPAPVEPTPEPPVEPTP